MINDKPIKNGMNKNKIRREGERERTGEEKRGMK